MPDVKPSAMRIWSSGGPRRRAALVALVALAGAGMGAAGCQASGSSVRVSSYMRAAVPIDEVEMHFRPVERLWTVVALIEARAGTDRFGTVEEAEAAAYERLRKQAARAGATAVVEIEQTVRGEQDEAGTPTGHQIVEASAKAVVFD